VITASVTGAVLTATVASMLAFAGASHAQVKARVPDGLFNGQAKAAPSIPTPFTTAAEQCIVPAANFHGLNALLLRAVLRVESSLKPDAIGRNKNGTFDIGIGQINSIHLPELKKFGIEPGHLADACVGTYVSGWFLKRAIAARGYTWEGVASYHSRTPEFNVRYQRLLIAEIQKSQIQAPDSDLTPTPIGPKSVIRNQPEIATGVGALQKKTEPAGEPGMMVFEQQNY
jgi:hypothetical protein